MSVWAMWRLTRSRPAIPVGIVKLPHRNDGPVLRVLCILGGAWWRSVIPLLKPLGLHFLGVLCVSTCLVTPPGSTGCVLSGHIVSHVGTCRRNHKYMKPTIQR